MEVSTLHLMADHLLGIHSGWSAALACFLFRSVSGQVHPIQQVKQPMSFGLPGPTPSALPSPSGYGQTVIRVDYISGKPRLSGNHRNAAQAAPSGERVSMFEDFVREKEKKEREAKKAERKKRMAAFRQVLDSTKSIKVRLARLSLDMCRCREVHEKASLSVTG